MGDVEVPQVSWCVDWNSPEWLFVLSFAGKKKQISDRFICRAMPKVKIRIGYFDYFCKNSESKENHYSYRPGLSKPLNTADGPLVWGHTYSAVKKYLHLHPYKITSAHNLKEKVQRQACGILPTV
jgi:hypothetical protein